ncbi:MAG: NTP transferase domain-containing protein [Syntrophomonadaceae bacterium]|nr:NTP transferase domain-containing protein [Syntrophomonadaceae bacterium]
MSTVAIIQARMSSSRLPGKVLNNIVGKPMLAHIVERLARVALINEIVVATSNEISDQPIYDFCQQNNINCYRGSLNDVLDRFYKTAMEYEAGRIIRITGDCPCVDPELVTQLINLSIEKQYDHVGIATGAGAIFDEARFPNGLDAESFNMQSLERAWKEAKKTTDREHVTPYIWRNKDIFKCGSLKPDKDYSYIRLSVDHGEDFELITKIFEELYNPQKPFLMNDIIEFLYQNPELLKLNQDFIGKEGYRNLWKDK